MHMKDRQIYELTINRSDAFEALYEDAIDHHYEAIRSPWGGVILKWDGEGVSTKPTMVFLDAEDALDYLNKVR